MMNTHKYLAGAAVLLGALSLSSAPAYAGNGLDLLTLMPQDTAMVMSADARALSGSKLAKDIFNTLGKGGKLSEFDAKMAAAGVDPARDIATVAIGMAGDFETSDNMVVVLEGRFNSAKIVASVKKESTNFAKKSHQGTTYYQTDDSEMTFVGGRLVATPKGKITAVIDRSKGKAKSARDNKGLMALAKSSYSKRNLWAVIVLTAEMRKDIANETGGHAIETVVMGIDLQTDLSIHASMGASDKTGANALATVIKAARDEAAKDPSMSMMGLDAPLRTMTVAVNGKNVDIVLTVPAAPLQTILGMVGGML